MGFYNSLSSVCDWSRYTFLVSEARQGDEGAGCPAGIGWFEQATCDPEWGHEEIKTTSI